VTTLIPGAGTTSSAVTTAARGLEILHVPRGIQSKMQRMLRESEIQLTLLPGIRSVAFSAIMNTAACTTVGMTDASTTRQNIKNKLSL
jgi:hypothetical protein